MPQPPLLAPELTRIVTCYRQWSLLRAWIDDERLFAPWIQWIVVNDHPDTPCPPDLAAVFQSKRIRILTPPANMGRCQARNLGALEATTRWIEHLDGDDIPLPIALTALELGREADLILFPMLSFNDHEVPPREPEPVASDSECYWGFLFPNFRPIDPRLTCTLWRRETFLRLHGYSDRFDGNEDLHLMWKAHQAGIRVARCAYPKQAYRLHERIGIRNKPEYFESLRFYQWLRRHCTPEQERPLDLLIGRQILAAARLIFLEAWKRRREITAFMRAKVSGEFFRLYR